MDIEYDYLGGVLGEVYQPGLENLGGRKAHVGSNPTSSAKKSIVSQDTSTTAC